MDILEPFEKELTIIRRYCREFAERYPKVAGRLQMSGEVCEDPHVERLIEAVALLSARISKRLDDDYPQFTEALLEVLFPHYLRPFPSCAIVQVDSSAAISRAGTVSRIARGTEMESALVHGVRCKFRSAYDVVIAPLQLASVKFEPLISAPANVALPRDASASISIVIEGGNEKVCLPQLGLDTLRVYIDGEPSLCAALRDTLFIKTVRAYVDTGDGQWMGLSAIPLKPVGFTNEEGLIPFSARSHPAYRILTEYFSFPDKFNFVDIDLAALMAKVPPMCKRLTLHLAIAGLRHDSSVARTLRGLSSANLRLGCTPVVNLFKQGAVPIAVTQQTADYRVLAHATRPASFEVYSIDSVHMLRQRGKESVPTEFRPFYSLRHGENVSRRGHYWLMRHDETIAAISPGLEKSITLIDADLALLTQEKTSLSINLSCTNRDLPGMLRYGQADGDLSAPDAAQGHRIRFLRKPTPSHRFGAGNGQQWRLISHLTLNHHSLANEGLPALQEMLTLYDLPQSLVSQRQIGGIVGLEHSETATWMRGKRGASLVHGIEVRLTLDEEAFVGSSLHLFVQVIDQFLGLYVQLNSFVELVVLSNRTGEELIRCKPRSGNLNLV